MSKLKDVAKMAGVSTATVSRVINTSSNVKEETKKKVLEAMAALNYHPNMAARMLVSGKSQVIGFTASDYLGSVFPIFLDEIEQNLQQNNKYMIVNTGHGIAAKEKTSLEFLINSGVDGIIAYSEALDETTLIEISQRIPLAILNRTIDDLKDNCVTQDNRFGIYQIIEHLYHQGFTEASFIFGPQHKPDGRERKESALTYCQEFGIQPLYQMDGDFTFDTGYRQMKEMLGYAKRPKLVICGNDDTAMGALKAMNEAGLKCPQDIALTGYDDAPNLAIVSTPITTVRLPIRRMSREAVKLIMNLTYKQKFNVTHIFEPELIIRESSLMHNG